AACARDHDPGVLDPLQCYNPCKHWCCPMFCPLHQTLQVATPVTNVGGASRNRTNARLRLVHVSRHRRKGSTPHPGPLPRCDRATARRVGRGGEGERSGKGLRFDLRLWTGFRYTGATGVTFRFGGREIRANIPHPHCILLRQSSRQRQSPKSKVQSRKGPSRPDGGFVRILAVPNAVPSRPKGKAKG